MTAQRNAAWGNRHRSVRLIQSPQEPRLECNSILSDDPVEPTVELFLLLFFFFLTCSMLNTPKAHTREGQQEWKRIKCPWANLYIFSMRWARRKKRKRKRKASSSTQQPQSARHYRLGDNTRTFCFALPAFLFYPKGWRGKTKKAQEHKRGERDFCMRLASDLRGRFQWFVIKDNKEDMEIGLFCSYESLPSISSKQVLPFCSIF